MPHRCLLRVRLSQSNGPPSGWNDLASTLGPDRLIVAYLDGIYILSPDDPVLEQMLAFSCERQPSIRLDPAKCKMLALGDIQTNYCLNRNSCAADQVLMQGNEAGELQMTLHNVRQTIGQNEQGFRQFAGIFQETSQKWETECKDFCDVIVWAYANAVSQVCVEDDGSCDRIRERLEQFEPLNDIVPSVRGWGTGDAIPDPPKSISYSPGEYCPSFAEDVVGAHPSFRSASPAPGAPRPPSPARIPPQNADNEPRASAPAPGPVNHYARSASPAPMANQYTRAASRAPAGNQYARAASPGPRQQQQQYGSYGRTSSPQPCYERSGECIDLDLLELLYYTYADC
ncbi:hypothetical protein EHS25_004727 [Saitozyma podzolica]|uniref:Uncharacterized protein n=1 Tax=Saitozyma podzolica TaxID=1890683 RepID=A0A427Y2M6_9TREE|nr:hypothetical protein EHS25_004727 [Saitozyma podzolica]